MFVVAVLAVVAQAESPQPTDKIGDVYEITLTRDTSSHSDDNQSSSSSHDQDTIIERVIDVRGDDLELEYDLPKDATADDRSRQWQFPARVFKPLNGPALLLNKTELETRVDAWLRKAGWPRTVCGRWIFTWNAFQIECDPKTVLETIQAFDLRSADLREGASYKSAGARTAGTLIRKGKGSAWTFATAMDVDPDSVRRARAESDVVVGEIMRKPVTLEAALRERSKEAISGKISVTFETNAAGRAVRRTTVRSIDTRMPDGRSETETTTETLERRFISPD
jgi:hypothetical protein